MATGNGTDGHGIGDSLAECIEDRVRPRPRSRQKRLALQHGFGMPLAASRQRFGKSRGRSQPSSITGGSIAFGKKQGIVPAGTVADDRLQPGAKLRRIRDQTIMNRLFERYGPWKGPIQGRQNGVLISMEQGEAVAYALNALEDRGTLFVSPGEKLYEGMIIGENAKPQDLEVNPLKSKQLTNFRASGKDEGIRLTPPRKMTLEQAIAYIQDDELVEVTPQSIRLRKRYLDPHERKKMARRDGA